MKKLLTIIGARPQIIKAAALNRVIKTNYSDQIEEIILHTGQHYDENMSAVFFNELNLPIPTVNLQVGSSSHVQQIAEMMLGIETYISQNHVDAILVYGDTNSTLAGALVASKLLLPLIHVEAGLRSYDKTMPEESNRILCDHLSTFLFCPTKQAVANLVKEGFALHSNKKINSNQPLIVECGDVMLDNCLYFKDIAKQNVSILQEIQIEENNYVLVTLHRNLNTDTPNRLKEIILALLEIVNIQAFSIVFPLHPRTKKKIEETFEEELKSRFFQHPKINIIKPVGYFEMLVLETNSKLIITDSGGVQKEAFFLKKPVLILRNETEWVEIVTNGNAILTDANFDKIVTSFEVLITKKDFTFPPFYGDGNAAELIVQTILKNS